MVEDKTRQDKTWQCTIAKRSETSDGKWIITDLVPRFPPLLAQLGLGIHFGNIHVHVYDPFSLPLLNHPLRHQVEREEHVLESWNRKAWAVGNIRRAD